MEQLDQVFAKPVKRLQLVGSGFHDFRFRLKDCVAFPLNEYAHNLTHAPTRSSQNLQAVNTWDQQGDTVVANYGDTFREAIEGLQFEPSEIDFLELLSGVHSETRSHGGHEGTKGSTHA